MPKSSFFDISPDFKLKAQERVLNNPSTSSFSEERLKALDDEYTTSDDAGNNKKNRGRGAGKGTDNKDTTQEQPIGDSTETLIKGLKMVSGAVLDIAAHACKVPDDEEITDSEKELFNEAAAPVVQKYFPQFMNYAAELALLTVAIGIAYPRWKSYQERQREKKKEKGTLEQQAELTEKK